MKRIDVRGRLTEDVGYCVQDQIRAVPPGAEIKLRLESEGGKMFAALLIALGIEEHDGIVETIATEAHSAAGLILACSDVRRLDRRGSVLVHNPQPYTEGGASEFASILASYVGRLPWEVRNWMNRETVFGATEARRVGLVDSVVDADGLPIVRLRATPKRRPSPWLRSVRQDFERWDIR
jgi:ATP-dependent protease ClpP protease subunit